MTSENGFIQLYRPDAAAIRAELNSGLLALQAVISPKYLYDALGSKLFEAICELPEYYPTRTEAAIFAAHAKDIAHIAGRGMTLVDLGAGNCAKAARLFDTLTPSHYVPVDISVEFLRDAVGCLRRRFPDIGMTAIGMDFSGSLDLPAAVPEDNRLFFYPGSSIGNFTPQEALNFLQRVRQASGPDGGLLIGVDLVKDESILNAAYDDAIGLTAAFNLNMLRHLNGLLGADFSPADWRHRGFFNPEQGRVEMHLDARHDVQITWSGGRRQFRQGESIHTENSYKYTRHGFMHLLEQAGFSDIHAWTDPRGWFLVCHARSA